MVVNTEMPISERNEFFYKFFFQIFKFFQIFTIFFKNFQVGFVVKN